jgi:hypothetical protein
VKDAAQRGRGIWRSLSGDQRLAAGAAVALFVTMFLPWYQYTAVAGRGAIADSTVNAFQVFDFTEAAVLLVAAAVLALLVGRAEGGTFSLPGRDGTFVFAGGIWVCLLIFLRQLDKPDGPDGTVVGVAWGIFVAFLAGIALGAAGWRMRQDEAPGPPLLRSDRGEGEDAPTAATVARPPAPEPAPAAGRGDTASAHSQDSLFDDLPGDDPEPPTRPMRPGEIPPAR